MKILRNDKDFQNCNFYLKNHPETNKTVPRKDYPKKYPCICEIVARCGGIMGKYMSHEFVDIPQDVDENSFLKGYLAGRAQQSDENSEFSYD